GRARLAPVAAGRLAGGLRTDVRLPAAGVGRGPLVAAGNAHAGMARYPAAHRLSLAGCVGRPGRPAAGMGTAPAAGARTGSCAVHLPAPGRLPAHAAPPAGTAGPRGARIPGHRSRSFATGRCPVRLAARPPTHTGRTPSALPAPTPAAAPAGSSCAAVRPHTASNPPC